MGSRGRYLLGLVALALSITIGQAKEPKHNKNAEVTVEVKFASLDQSVVRQLEYHGLLAKENEENGIRSLDNAQLNRFMEIAQSDPLTNVMQAPRLTAFNGQNAVFKLMDEQTFVTGLEIASHDGQIEYKPKNETISLGWRIALRSVVSKDRRFVRVHLDAKSNSLDSSAALRFPITTPSADGKAGMVMHYIEYPKVNKITVNRTMVIPDGKTAVLTTGFKKEELGRNEYGTPILCDLPLIGRLFRTVGYSCRTSHLVVLVTPHIDAQKEKVETRSK